jgi:hypothetical protein
MVKIAQDADLEYINSKIQLSAFPSHGSMGEIADRGMTLRDWFAGHAMQDMLTGRVQDFEAISKNAYILADAMLKAREENGARP